MERKKIPQIPHSTTKEIFKPTKNMEIKHRRNKKNYIRGKL